MLDFIPKSIQRKGTGVLAIAFNTIVVKIDGWMDGRTDGRKEGRMDGWMEGRMDGWVDG